MGESHACTIGSGGGIKCWGWNGDGQLGTGGTADQRTPMDVPGAEKEASTQKCSMFIAGVKSDKSLAVWRTVRRLGVGRLNFAAETSLPGLSVGAIALGASHTCAIMSDGSVKCWGLNSYGQLGIGSTAWQGSVVNVPGTLSVIEVCVPGGMLMNLLAVY